MIANQRAPHPRFAPASTTSAKPYHSVNASQTMNVQRHIVYTESAPDSHNDQTRSAARTPNVSPASVSNRHRVTAPMEHKSSVRETATPFAVASHSHTPAKITGNALKVSVDLANASTAKRANFVIRKISVRVWPFADPMGAPESVIHPRTTPSTPSKSVAPTPNANLQQTVSRDWP